MKLDIEKELLQSFNLYEADNEDGTDNDGGEKVLPGDVQHGFKSKVMSKDIINPTLQEVELSNHHIKPSDISGDTVYYTQTIDDNKVKVIIFNDGDLGVVDFEVNDSFDKEKEIKQPFMIYDYVVNCITSYLKDNEPNKLIFSPNNKDQEKMYNLFLKTFNTKETGYTLSKNSNVFVIQKDKDIDEMRRYAGL